MNSTKESKEDQQNSSKESGYLHSINPFEEYKFFADMTDRLSERRQHIHTIFEAILTALLGLAAFIAGNEGMAAGGQNSYLMVTSGLGIIICLIWWNLINNYKKLIKFRFKVLVEMEATFTNSVRMYTRENEFFSEEHPDEPFRFSITEQFMPIVFAGIFGLIILFALTH